MLATVTLVVCVSVSACVCVCVCVAGEDTQGLTILGKCSTSELYPQPHNCHLWGGSLRTLWGRGLLALFSSVDCVFLITSTHYF
jgi:hypothetical protein